jgi:hypothetical protein
MVTSKSPIVPTTWATHGQLPSDANEEVPMVTQLDEKRWHLWEMVEANLEKAHKWYKDSMDKSQWEVNFQERDEVWLNIKKFRTLKGLSHKFLGPYVSPFKMLEKKFPNIYKLELSENLKVHHIFHFHFWSKSPMMRQVLIENTTQGLQPTSPFLIVMLLRGTFHHALALGCTRWNCYITFQNKFIFFSNSIKKKNPFLFCFVCLCVVFLQDQSLWRAPKSRGETKSSCEKLRLGGTLPASNSRKG